MAPSFQAGKPQGMPGHFGNFSIERETLQGKGPFGRLPMARPFRARARREIFFKKLLTFLKNVLLY